ncbi:hypothetical protein [Noviluteimonas gilva]|uniref:Uncharacterized protein n=1 Tax=Noviluteimonas gilva TaxID=2682097 RepID=A0A7C9HYZ7_9GAMM|nr:hypothetical protein [Lysobacter gilvus]MUV14534.1 hypothetical protein [Lysobacter gilvus]
MTIHERLAMRRMRIAPVDVRNTHVAERHVFGEIAVRRSSCRSIGRIAAGWSVTVARASRSSAHSRNSRSQNSSPSTSPSGSFGTGSISGNSSPFATGATGTGGCGISTSVSVLA